MKIFQTKMGRKRWDRSETRDKSDVFFQQIIASGKWAMWTNRLWIKKRIRVKATWTTHTETHTNKSQSLRCCRFCFLDFLNRSVWLCILITVIACWHNCKMLHWAKLGNVNLLLLYHRVSFFLLFILKIPNCVPYFCGGLRLFFNLSKLSKHLNLIALNRDLSLMHCGIIPEHW